jgi:hypothetical protein
MNIGKRARSLVSAAALSALGSSGAATVLSAQDVTPADSIRVARERGSALGARTGAGRYVLGGFVFLPAVAAAGLVGGSEWDKNKEEINPLPLIAAAGLTVGYLASVRSNARSVNDPSPAVIAAEIGDASPAARQAFVDAYKARVHRKRRGRFNTGIVLGTPVIVGFGALLFVAMAGT